MNSKGMPNKLTYNLGSQHINVLLNENARSLEFGSLEIKPVIHLTTIILSHITKNLQKLLPCVLNANWANLCCLMYSIQYWKNKNDGQTVKLFLSQEIYIIKYIKYEIYI